MKKTSQRGVGMMEILVALLLLAIAVLGFVALQVRAVAGTDEAIQKVDAMNLARNLAERIRANRDGYATYVSALNATTQVSTASTTCLSTSSSTAACTSTQMATYDSAQIVSMANDLGMKIRMPACTVTSTVARQCIYVAWNQTTATNGTSSDNDCTSDGAYLPKASCVIMELY